MEEIPTEEVPESSATQQAQVPKDPPQVRTNPGKPRHGFNGKTKSKHGTPRFSPYNQQNARVNTEITQPSGFLSVMHNYFSIQLNLEGIDNVVRLTYETLLSREPRAVQQLSQLEFLYAMKLLIFVRLYFVIRRSSINEYAECHFLESMINTAKGIVLPDFLASYIDGLGVVMVNYKRIIPYTISPKDFVNEGYFGNPYDPDEPVTYENFRDVFTLGQFNTRFIRVKTIAHSLRPLNFNTIMGKPEMLVSYYTNPQSNKQVEARSAYSLTMESAKRGACYRYWDDEVDRDSGDYSQFPTQSFNSPQFDWEDFARNILNATIVPMYD